jgi:hypothetical protein
LGLLRLPRNQKQPPSSDQSRAGRTSTERTPTQKTAGTANPPTHGGNTTTTTDLLSVLTAHAAWLADPSTGTRADLSEANLSGVVLREANLRGAK